MNLGDNMNIFDIIGPVMIGPSSSHTAGAIRIARVARMLLGEEVAKALIKLHGSFAETYLGHGTDKAIIGGLLNFDTDDIRIRDSIQLAEEAGMQYTFETTDLGEVHPNTAYIEVTGRSGRSISVMGSSIGGGNIVITRINGLEVEFTGQYHTLVIQHRDKPGMVARVSGILSGSSINIASMKVYRTSRGGNAIMVIETDDYVDGNISEIIKQIPDIFEATSLHKL